MRAYSRTWCEISATEESLPQAPVSLNRAGTTMIVVGGLMAIAGAIALTNTFTATAATVYALGFFLIAGGIMNTIHAFTIRRWNLAVLDVLGAFLYFIAAIFTFRQPLATAATITVMLAALFMVGGGMRFFAALAMQPAHWAWLMVNGFVTFMLGVLLLFGMPLTGLTGPGLLVGVDLFLSGVAAIAFGFETRRAASRVTHGGIARLAGRIRARYGINNKTTCQLQIQTPDFSGVYDTYLLRKQVPRRD